jgi:hypothetical protein
MTSLSHAIETMLLAATGRRGGAAKLSAEFELIVETHHAGPAPLRGPAAKAAEAC